MSTTTTYVSHTGESLKRDVYRNLGRNRYYVEIGGTPFEILYVHENVNRNKKTWEIQFRGKNFGSLTLEVGGRITIRVDTKT